MRSMPDISKDKRFWSAKEAASYLMVSVQTLYAWCNGPKRKWRESKLIGPKPPYRKFGRNVYRFPIVEFKQWSEHSPPRKDN